MNGTDKFSAEEEDVEYYKDSSETNVRGVGVKSNNPVSLRAPTYVSDCYCKLSKERDTNVIRLYWPVNSCHLKKLNARIFPLPTIAYIFCSDKKRQEKESNGDV